MYFLTFTKFLVRFVFTTFAIGTLLSSVVYANELSDDNPCQFKSTDNVIHVNGDTTEKGNGSNWNNALKTINEALQLAATFDGYKQIWVAQGSYQPYLDYENPLLLTDGVAIIGGFNGTESSVEQREKDNRKTQIEGPEGKRIIYSNGINNAVISDISLNGAILMRDLAQDRMDKSNRIQGAALLAHNSDIILCNVNVSDNTARKFGGGIYIQEGNLSIFYSVFENNRVIRGEDEVHDSLDEADTDGGAIAAQDAVVIVRNSRFSDNISGDDGAAISGRRIDLEISNSEFIRNIAIATTLVQSNPIFTEDFLTSMGGALSIIEVPLWL